MPGLKYQLTVWNRFLWFFSLQNCKGALRMGTLIKNWALEHDIDGQENFMIINLDVYLTAFLSINGWLLNSEKGKMMVWIRISQTYSKHFQKVWCLRHNKTQKFSFKANFNFTFAYRRRLKDSIKTSKCLLPICLQTLLFKPYLLENYFLFFLGYLVSCF